MYSRISMDPLKQNEEGQTASVVPPTPLPTSPLNQESVSSQAPNPPSETKTPTPTPFPIPSSPLMKPTSNLTGRPGGFRTFVIFALVIIVIIYGVVAYLYFQNRNIEKDEEGDNQTPQDQISPTPEFSADQVKIQDGSVVSDKPGTELQILINKDDYESTGITGFAKVTVSPDNTNLCFESWPPAPEPALYLSRVDGSEVTEVSPNRQGCIWASNGSKIYYINTAASSSPVNIYSFVLSSKSEENLTIGTIPEGVIRRFGIVGLSADSSKLICKYEDIDSTPKPTSEVESGNQCEIDLQTNEVTLL